VILSYRRFLAWKNRVLLVDPNDLVDWDQLELNLRSPTTNDGQVSKLELLCIVGLAKQRLKSGDNFLEIGTFDGSTALNIALNLPENSTVITIDLPEGTQAKPSGLKYDEYLIAHASRSHKKHLGQPNVEQVFQDSTKVNFEKFSFSGAFIDGAHDYTTVNQTRRMFCATSSDQVSCCGTTTTLSATWVMCSTNSRRNTRSLDRWHKAGVPGSPGRNCASDHALSVREPVRFLSGLMKTLITGASGFVGSALTNPLGSGRDWDLRAAERRSLPDLPTSVEQVLPGDLTDGADWPRISEFDGWNPVDSAGPIRARAVDNIIMHRSVWDLTCG